MQSGLAQLPKLVWAKGFGSSSSGWGFDTKTDAAGNVYVAGFFVGNPDFDPGPSTAILTSAGGQDGYVAKFDASGNYVWAVRMGGPTNDTGFDLALDGAGGVYVTGIFTGTASFGSTNLTALGGNDAFVAKLDNNGNFIWAKSFGGSAINGDFSHAIGLNASGDVFLAGYFYGTADFDPGAATASLTSSGQGDNFVLKLDNNGNYQWAVRSGSTAIDVTSDLAIDGSGNIYVAGFLTGSGTTFGALPTLSSIGQEDVYVAKLTPAGAFQWAVRAGSTGRDLVDGLALTPTGFPVVTGFFQGTVDFDPGSGTTLLSSNGGMDAYVLQLDANGNYLWAQSFGGPLDDQGNGLAIQSNGNIFIEGSFQGTVDFDPGTGSFQMTSASASQNDIYVSQLDPNGTFITAGKMGGPGSDTSTGIFLSGNNLFLTGLFQNTSDFDPSTGTYNVVSLSTYSSFITKLDFGPPIITSISPGSGPVGTAITINGTGFSNTASLNKVHMGAALANVLASSPSQLTVEVPQGTTLDPLSVTTEGLSGFSRTSFLATFPNGGLFNACSFTAPVNYGASNFGHGLAAGDLDGDGKVDLVTTNAQLGIVQVFRNTSTQGDIGSNSFAAPVDLTVGSGSSAVALGDIDGDGKLDIVASGFNSNTVSIFRNLSSPGSLTTSSFSTRVDLSANSQPLNIALADLDLDGKVDVAVSDNNTGTISIWRNIGSVGSISAASFASKFTISTQSAGFAVTDMDLDGKPDLIGGQSIGTQLGILRNISTPGSLSAASFQTRQDFTVGAWVEFLDIGDLDQDGRPDIVASSWPDGAFSILKNTSTAGTINSSSFAPRVVIPFTSGLTEPRGVDINDLDGDGLPEITVLAQVAGKMLVYKNSTTPGNITTGTFSSPYIYPAGGNLRRILSADFDGDGKPDVATTSWSGPSLNVIHNEVAGPPVASGYSPTSGSVGTLVTISGNNFSIHPANNMVTFNGTPGIVTAATPTQLSVLVPGAATTGPVVVTVNCASAITLPSFSVTPIIYNPCNTIKFIPDETGVPPYVEVTRNPFLEPSSLTIEMMVNFSSIPTHGTMIAKPNSASTGSSYALWYQGGMLRGGVRLGAGIGFSWTPTVNKWYHVAFTYNDITQQQKLYIDGLPVASGTSLPPTYAADNLLIGADMFGGFPDFGFPGQLDEIRLWDGERKEQEILQNLTTTLTGGEPNLLLYHRISESGQGAGITVTNYAETGTVNNGVTRGDTSNPQFVGTCVCIPVSERNALIAVYNATDGAHWTNNSGWLSADEHTWYGVGITGCHITSLTLPSNHLVGSIPPDVSGLPQLITLDLSNNELGSSVPTEIAAIISLKTLNLSHNRLSDNLPAEMADMVSLQAAFLNNNQFTGQPALVGLNSYAMSVLHLQNNLFTDLPDFTSYFDITEINVANNQLTFDDLEPFASLSNFTYDPQADLPPGGIVSFLPGDMLYIPFFTGGSANSYQWFKGTTAISGAIDPELTIDPASLSDLGTYHVEITNSIMPLLTLRSLPYTAILDPCPGGTRTAGALDTGFNPLINSPSTFFGTGLQSSGMILASTSYTVVNSVVTKGLLRFHPDGTLDNTFTADYEGVFLVLPDDRIYATYNDGTYSYPVLLDANGVGDINFNSNVEPYYSGNITAIGLEANGKLLVAGTQYMTPPFVERFRTDGISEGTLSGADGKYVNVIKVQADGEILLGGSFTGGIIRLDPSGIPDPTFVTIGASDYVTDILIQPDGRILVAGAFQYFNNLLHYGIVRLNTDGSIDNSFTAPGITDPITLGSWVQKIALQADGKIIVAGSFDSFNGTQRKNIIRLNADGSVDCSFDPGISADAAIEGLSIQFDGQIVINGSFTTYEGVQENGLARINNGTITITLQPNDASTCNGSIATFTTAATGTTNITYQWQYSVDGIAPYADISNSGGYSNVTTSTLTVNTSGTFGAGRYRCRINGDNAGEVVTADKQLTVVPLPSPPLAIDGNNCGPGTVSLGASGSTNGNYRWYTVATGGTALTGEVNATFITPSLTATTSFYVAINNGTCESSRTSVTANIVSIPTAPTATPLSSCTPTSFNIFAVGGIPGDYRWYTVATGGVPLPGETYSTYVTPVLSTTTTYYVSLNNGTCESSRTAVTASINAVAKPIVTTSNCTATGATLTAPPGFATYAWSNGATTPQIVLNTPGTYTVVVTSLAGCTSPSSDPITFTSTFCNQSPVIQPTSASTTIQGTATIDLTSLASDTDNNLDLSTLAIASPPISGAAANINAKYELVVDYSNVSFTGTDQLAVRVCDIAGACSQNTISIEVNGEITIFNAVSPNGDGLNDVLYIEYVDLLPQTRENKVTIFNRWGSVVFEVQNYDNVRNVFRGTGSNGNDLPSGTYFYTIEFASGEPKRTGYISLRK